MTRILFKATNGKYRLSNHILPFLYISLAGSILYLIELPTIVGFVALTISQPPKLAISPLLQKFLFCSYVTFFNFILFTILLFVPYIALNQISKKILKIKTYPQRYTFAFLFFIIGLYGWIISSKISTTPNVPNFWIIPSAIILMAIIYFLYLWLQKNAEISRLVGSSAAAFVTLAIFGVIFSILDNKFLTPLTKKNMSLAVFTLAFCAIGSLLLYYALRRLTVPLIRKKNISKLCSRIFFFVIILVSGISILGFLLESKNQHPDYKEITSGTKKNINILFIVLDALRADHLGCYGYPRDTSPTIDGLAKEGVLFKNCYTQVSWTKPSVGSLLTSLYPTMHGAVRAGDILPESATTLAEILQKDGYITYGLTTNVVIKAKFNFSQGFDFFDDYLMRDRVYESALRNLPLSNLLKKITGKYFEFTDRDNIRVANKKIIPWLEKYHEQNFFMYLHYMDPHAPYSPPPPYNNMYNDSRLDENSRNIALYDGEIRYADDHIKKLFEKLKLWRIYDKMVIILTSDHGEAFGEHGDFHHGHTIYQEQLKVPLIIKCPECVKNRIIERQVRSIDIMPTVLDILDISPDLRLEGTSLKPFLKGKEVVEYCEDIFIEEECFYGNYMLKGIIADNKWKLIRTEKSKLRDVKKQGQLELYDLEIDPEEMHNLIDQRPEILKKLQGKLNYYQNYSRENKIPAPEAKRDPGTLRQIRALGYLQ